MNSQSSLLNVSSGLIGMYLEQIMNTTNQRSKDSIVRLNSIINTFKNKLMELEQLAVAIDSEVYQMSSNSIFQFEDYNINEGLDLLHSILSRRIYFLNEREKSNEENN